MVTRLSAPVASGSTQQTAHITPMTEQSLLDAAGTTGWAAHRLARSPHMYVSVGLVDVLSVCDIVITPPLTQPMRRHLLSPLHLQSILFFMRADQVLYSMRYPPEADTKPQRLWPQIFRQTAERM